MNNYRAILNIVKTKRPNKSDFRFDDKKDKKRKPREYCRTVFIRGESIINALDTVKKIRYAKLRSLNQITQEEYVKGVSGASKSYGFGFKA